MRVRNCGSLRCNSITKFVHTRSVSIWGHSSLTNSVTKKHQGQRGLKDYKERIWNTHTHPSIHPSIHTYIHTSIHPSIHPSIHIYIHTYIHTYNYIGVSKRFRTGRQERELQMVQLSATRCSCIAILWVSLVSFAATTLCVPSQRVLLLLSFISLSTKSGNFWIHPRACVRAHTHALHLGLYISTFKFMWRFQRCHFAFY
jgi:hypothetical protein